LQIEKDERLSFLLIRLLKGTINSNEKQWQDLLLYRNSVTNYFSFIGLKLEFFEEDGFAFLSQIDEDESEIIYPKLVRRMPLSFEISLLLVILREELDRFDSSPTTEYSLFLNRAEIRSLIELYFEDKSDAVKLISELDRYMNQTVKLGFLKEVKNSSNDENFSIEPSLSETSSPNSVFEVLRIIRARITPEFLTGFKEKLEAEFGSV